MVVESVAVCTGLGGVIADRLPRWLRAVYLRDPQRLRHEMALSDWALDPKLPSAVARLRLAVTGTRVH